MSQDNPYRIFVSHAWAPEHEYHRVFEYLESASNFYYKNCSNPETGAGQGKEALQAAMRQQIESAEVVILLSSLARANPEWMNFQLHAALAMKKPIIVMEPFGGEEIDPVLAEKADAMARWEARSIEDAIRMCSRHEETQRWDVIEWDPD